MTDKISKQDLPDSPKDKEHLKPETVILNLPDVSNIPGQEHIKVPPLGELADTTISSADEEGDSVFKDSIQNDSNTDLDEGNVTDEEREALKRADEDMPTPDDIGLRRTALDNTDADGDLLNEKSFKNDIAGEDLDVPGAENDDKNEEIGEEDEENNQYSLGGDKHD